MDLFFCFDIWNPLVKHMLLSGMNIEFSHSSNYILFTNTFRRAPRDQNKNDLHWLLFSLLTIIGPR